jgi:hypothetical protein
VLPYGSIRTELIEGRLSARRIQPSLHWTLSLALPARRELPVNDVTLFRLTEHIVDDLLMKLGPLATRIWSPGKQEKSLQMHDFSEHKVH